MRVTWIVLLFIVESETTKQLCIVASTSSKLASCELKEDDQVSARFESSVKIITLDNKKEFDVLIEYVAQAFSNRKCAEVIGMIGDLDLRSAGIIHTLASRADLNITLVSAVAPSTFLPTTHLALPNLLHMNSLTHYVEALAAFLDHLSWTRIGLISDDTPYYEFAAELIQQKLLENTNRRIIPFVRISYDDNKTKAVRTFKDYLTDVVIISARSEVACQLIQEAQEIGYTWPKCAWIIFDVGSEACYDGGAILFRDRGTFSPVTVRCANHEISISWFLYNSILALSAADDIPLHNASYLGRNQQVTFREGTRLTNISVIFVNSSGSSQELAYFNAELHDLFERSFPTGERPRGQVLKARFRNSQVTQGTTLVASILSVLVTAVLVLYLCFYREPEIKATSVTVSLCMFLGCYILLLYLPLQVIDPLGKIHCNTLAWPSLCGVPFQLIMATLFAKMLRIYFIFSDPLSFKSKLLTDPFLFLYILLLVSPSFTLLVIWSSLDPVTIHTTETSQENSVFVHSRCFSVHITKWLSSLFAYTVMLSAALICLAIKTSEIRYKHFRDTKATNAFAYLSCFAAAITLIYFTFFSLQKPTASTVLVYMIFLHVGHCSLVLLCQSLLFIPKVYPPLKRKVLACL